MSNEPYPCHIGPPCLIIAKQCLPGLDSPIKLYPLDQMWFINQSRIYVGLSLFRLSVHLPFKISHLKGVQDMSVGPSRKLSEYAIYVEALFCIPLVNQCSEGQTYLHEANVRVYAADVHLLNNFENKKDGRKLDWWHTWPEIKVILLWCSLTVFRVEITPHPVRSKHTHNHHDIYS